MESYLNNAIDSVINNLNRNDGPYNYLADHCLFVTMHLPNDWKLPTRLEDRANTAFTRFRACYIQFVQDLLGNHFGTKLGLQPFTLAFLDFPGTRSEIKLDEDTLASYPTDQRAALEIANRRKWLDFRDRPHIHAIMLLHPLTTGRFEELFNQQPRCPTAPDRVRWPVRGASGTLLHIERFDFEKGDLPNLVSYAAKIGTVTGAGHSFKTFEIYPDKLSPEEYLMRARKALDRHTTQAAFANVANPFTIW